MIHLRSFAAAALALAIAGPAFMSPAHADEHEERCEPIPKEQWKPQAELERRLTNLGWKISKVKITNGCYEVYGRDAQNHAVEVFFHPVTFDVITAAKS